MSNVNYFQDNPGFVFSNHEAACQLMLEEGIVTEKELSEPVGEADDDSDASFGRIKITASKLGDIRRPYTDVYEADHESAARRALIDTPIVILIEQMRDTAAKIHEIEPEMNGATVRALFQLAPWADASGIGYFPNHASQFTLVRRPARVRVKEAILVPMMVQLALLRFQLTGETDLDGFDAGMAQPERGTAASFIFRALQMVGWEFSLEEICDHVDETIEGFAAWFEQ